MNPEYEGDDSKQDPITPSAEVLVRVDTDGGDHQTPDKIAFGGEAHATNVSAPELSRLERGGLSKLLRGTDRESSSLP